MSVGLKIMNTQKQIQYWIAGAEEDIDVAGELMEKKRYRYALFFSHLALEKILKAHYCRASQNIPPKIHNLCRLAELSGIIIDEKRMEFLRGFNVYQMEGRYPGEGTVIISSESAQTDFQLAMEMAEWLKSQF